MDAEQRSYTSYTKTELPGTLESITFLVTTIIMSRVKHVSGVSFYYTHQLTWLSLSHTHRAMLEIHRAALFTLFPLTAFQVTSRQLPVSDYITWTSQYSQHSMNERAVVVVLKYLIFVRPVELRVVQGKITEPHFRELSTFGFSTFTLRCVTMDWNIHIW